jgi:mono/diheme cytochrome c family protein
LLIIVVVGAIATTLFVQSGLYNVAADVPHTRPVHAMLESLRERSIARHAASVQPPDLEDAELIRQGSGNYDAMCVSCHLAPGVADTELSKGLYPTPPPLAKTGIDHPGEAFWVIKHGIKATGMPAWGKSMEDQYIWGMVAFLQELPKLDEERYRRLVASSGGHSHGGGETIAKPEAEGTLHHHADGSAHVHAPKPDAPKSHTEHKH